VSAHPKSLQWQSACSLELPLSTLVQLLSFVLPPRRPSEAIGRGERIHSAAELPHSLWARLIRRLNTVLLDD
jgi:hypothetical protein